MTKSWGGQECPNSQMGTRVPKNKEDKGAKTVRGDKGARKLGEQGHPNSQGGQGRKKLGGSG